jgi:hypothetical protein
MLNEGLSTDTTFHPCYILLDYTVKRNKVFMYSTVGNWR